MEIPEECLQTTERVTRKKKTDEEDDPDFAPVVPKKGGVEGGLKLPRQLRRSKTIEGIRKRPPPSLSYVKRVPYSVEDWRNKENENKQPKLSLVGDVATIKTSPSHGSKDHLAVQLYHGGGGGSGGAKEERTDNYELADIAPDALVEMDVEDFDLANLPNFVMGSGKGAPGGPPLYDFKSLWQYELPELTYDECMNKMPMYPWERSSAQPDITPKILSIVACFSVGQTLDLKKIAIGAQNVEFNPDRFAPLVMRVRNPKSTALIFRTGRIVLSGARSEDDCYKAAKKFVAIIRKFGGYRVDMLNFHIQNISAKCNLNFRVRLNHLSQNKLFGNLCYEPEIFPGLEIALESPKVKVRIFCTGSVVMSGAKSMEELNEAIRIVYPMVRMYAP